LINDHPAFICETMNILVAIKSCHKYVDRRKAQAETWLPHLATDYFFILGKPRLVDADSLSCNVSDAFADIAPKIKYACLYALDNKVDFMFVCDDDTYVRPERLLSSGFEKHDYVGHMRTDGLDYNKGIPYAQGSAYWLSARAMEIVAQSPIMGPGIIDDGAVGQALIDKVPFTHDWRYKPGPYPTIEELPHPENNVISCHKCLPDLMRTAHKPWKGK
jgi:hypothetical protein